MNRRDENVIVNSGKAPLHLQNGRKMELQRGKPQSAEKTVTNRRRSTRERKLALIQDVDNLKKKLRHEENVHRALERAFNRPLGALPRLPPYLPQSTLELLAEVAVLEEEVVRLEEQVVNFRQGLYQEAAYMSSRKSSGDLTPSRDDISSTRSSQQRHSRSLSQSEVSSGSSRTRPSPSLSRTASRKLPDNISDGSRHSSNRKLADIGRGLTSKDDELGREDQGSPDSDKDKSLAEKKSGLISTPVKGCQLKSESRNSNSPQTQCRSSEQAEESSSGSSDDRFLETKSEANKLSEDVLKCLISIFVRLSSSKGKTMDSGSLSSLTAKAFSANNAESDFQDPYYRFSEFRKREFGNYKHLYFVEAHTVNFKWKTNASFLVRRLKILLNKLESVKLDCLSHQQKLAFWINTHNSCIMNGFLEHGIPDSPDMIALQMQKATIKVGGYALNALMIEHLILRLPYHLKYNCLESTKTDESKICRTLGLEWSEPLVTFALSCGSWSSPAVRVYTASHIETELETAKKDYLQAAVGMSVTNKLVIPKLLDWYLLDFAKDMDALLDWICLQLPDKLRGEAVECLERKRKEPLSELVQVIPYNFSFRYLFFL